MLTRAFPQRLPEEALRVRYLLPFLQIGTPPLLIRQSPASPLEHRVIVSPAQAEREHENDP